MSAVVFILGAGASRLAGAPLMADFLDRSEALLRTGKVPHHREHFERILDARGKLQAVHSKSTLDISNIEEVFNAFELAKIIGAFPGGDEAYVNQAIASLRKVISVTLENLITFPVINKSKIGPPEPYQQFAELLYHLTRVAEPNNSASVITFNYDLAVDYALSFNSLGPDYAIGESVGRGIPLLKLHGSTNWAKCDVCGEVISFSLDDFFQKYHFPGLADRQSVFLQLSERLSNETHCDKALGPEPFIVPPTWNKADHHGAIAPVWRRAAKELSEAQYIFIVGYSMPVTDAFFRLLFCLGTVGPSLIKRLIIFNPDLSGLVEARYRSLVGPGAATAFEYSISDFEQCLGRIKNMFPGPTQ